MLVTMWSTALTCCALNTDVSRVPSVVLVDGAYTALFPGAAMAVEPMVVVGCGRDVTWDLRRFSKEQTCHGYEDAQIYIGHQLPAQISGVL